MPYTGKCRLSDQAAFVGMDRAGACLGFEQSGSGLLLLPVIKAGSDLTDRDQHAVFEGFAVKRKRCPRRNSDKFHLFVDRRTAAAAEIERREGYEVLLRAALDGCSDGGRGE